MFKLIMLFILVSVFSIFALNDFLGLWSYVREGLEYLIFKVYFLMFIFDY
ncbi:hypothetical protein [Spiroplasma endosymbiont of 'Nebria riversi']|nr:hypothetical protein [Spiroplasma endosymbiont of 'Nebria riversi']